MNDQAPIIRICLDIQDNQREINAIGFGNDPTTQLIDIENKENESLLLDGGIVRIDCDKPCGAFFSFTNENDCGALQFMNLAVGNIVSYDWDFGDGNTSTDANPSNQFASTGNYSVSLTIEDQNGCMDTYVESIAVQVDDLGPDLVCPSAITINCSESRMPDNTGVGNATDNCGIIGLSLNFQDEFLLNEPCNARIKRLWIASDQVGNVSTCEQLIFVTDDAAPVISDCPGEITVNSAADDCNTFVFVEDPMAADDCNLVVSFTNDFNSTGDANGFYPAGSTLVTWTAEDACGNISTCSHTVNVLDIIPPTVACLMDTRGNCSGRFRGSYSGLFFAND